MRQAGFPDDMTQGDRYWLTMAAQRAGEHVASLMTVSDAPGDTVEARRHHAKAALVQHAHGLPYLLQNPKVRAAWDWLAWQEIERRVPGLKSPT